MTVKQEMRYRALKAMDATVRDCVNDEGYLESWLMIGIPDDSTDLDFQEWAADDEDYTEFMETFIRLIERMDKDPDEWSKEALVDVFIQNL